VWTVALKGNQIKEAGLMELSIKKGDTLEIPASAAMILYK